MSKNSLSKLKFSDPSEYLKIYIKNKPDFVFKESTFDPWFELWTGNSAGNDFLNIKIIEENNILYCKVDNCELNNLEVAKFIIPTEYNDFKILLDILLK